MNHEHHKKLVIILVLSLLGISVFFDVERFLISIDIYRYNVFENIYSGFFVPLTMLASAVVGYFVYAQQKKSVSLQFYLPAAIAAISSIALFYLAFVLAPRFFMYSASSLACVSLSYAASALYARYATPFVREVETTEDAVAITLSCNAFDIIFSKNTGTLKLISRSPKITPYELPYLDTGISTCFKEEKKTKTKYYNVKVGSMQGNLGETGTIYEMRSRSEEKSLGYSKWYIQLKLNRVPGSCLQTVHIAFPGAAAKKAENALGKMDNFAKKQYAAYCIDKLSNERLGGGVTYDDFIWWNGVSALGKTVTLEAIGIPKSNADQIVLINEDLSIWSGPVSQIEAFKDDKKRLCIKTNDTSFLKKTLQEHVYKFAIWHESADSALERISACKKIVALSDS